MVVDALVVYGMDLEPGHASVLLKPKGNVANDVLDEHRIAVRSRKYGNVTCILALSAWRRPFRSRRIVGTVLMVTSPRWSFKTSTKRLIWVPLKWWGRLTDIVSVATVCCCLN